jgi:Putative beta-lactamase-inhibitor-like, PepSY-like
MKSKQWMAIAVCAVMTASCGDNSTKTDTTEKNDTVITTAPVTPPPTIEVPEATRTAFQTKYPTATNVNWGRYEPIEDFDWTWAGWPTLDSSDYYVRYNIDGNEYWSWYDDGNNWIGTVSTVNTSNLPAAVNTAVNSNFPGYTITSVKKENDKDRTAYEIKLEKGTDKAKLLVAEDGTVIKKVSTVDEEKTKEKI